jgi:hypothetical protein
MELVGKGAFDVICADPAPENAEGFEGSLYLCRRSAYRESDCSKGGLNHT